MATILSQPQCVNTLRPGNAYDASVNGIIIGSGNGLLPVQYQTITWTSADLMSHLSKIWINTKKIPCREMHLKCLQNDSLFIPPFEKQTYYAVAMSVRPSAFSGLFFNMLWDINLKLGIYIQ